MRDDQIETQSLGYYLKVVGGRLHFAQITRKVRPFLSQESVFLTTRARGGEGNISKSVKVYNLVITWVCNHIYPLEFNHTLFLINAAFLVAAGYFAFPR